MPVELLGPPRKNSPEGRMTLSSVAAEYCESAVKGCASCVYTFMGKLADSAQLELQASRSLWNQV